MGYDLGVLQVSVLLQKLLDKGQCAKTFLIGKFSDERIKGREKDKMFKVHELGITLDNQTSPNSDNYSSLKMHK